MRILLTLILTITVLLIAAQESSYYEGEVIVKMQGQNDINEVVKDLQFHNGKVSQLHIEYHISKSMNAWLLSFDNNVFEQDKFVQAVALHPNVEFAHNNQKIEYRATPNDANFNQQWQYINPGGSGGVPDADLDAELAWDMTTGGLTPEGDEIVIAVIDDGLDVNHPDFGNNIWVNTNEVPNNGVDDDNNGYVDDYEGWNIYDNSDDITDGGFGGGHGTPVAGIIGAQGNNNTGVTGVNWDVKVMVIVGGTQGGGTGQAGVVASYDYALEQRKLYDQTNGAKGAFVVATNSSWGIDFGDPASAPLWCAMYDSLGKYGIVSAGATINDNVNVDVQGDLPTGCSSDFLISVTNVARNDFKVSGAGYGATTVDLGSFGQDTYTTDHTAFSSGYGGFGGTSGATPHVAGAVGLLYSYDECPWFTELAKMYPDSAALLAKHFIMDGTDANTSLNSITVTGGRQNLHKMLLELDSGCLKCPSISSTNVFNITGTSAQLGWVPSSTDNLVEYKIRYKAVTEITWNETTVSIQGTTLTGLLPQTTYEVEIYAVCTDKDGPVSDKSLFTTLNVSIEEQLPDFVQIFPNPATDVLYITNNSNEKLTFQLFDISGKMVFNTSMESNQQTLNISNLATGVYVAKLQIAGTTYNYKVNKF